MTETAAKAAELARRHLSGELVDWLGVTRWDMLRALSRERKIRQVIARNVSEAGYKVEAKRLHPDKGGTDQNFARSLRK